MLMQFVEQTISDSAVHRSLLESQPLEENTELETTAHPSPQTGI